FLSVDPLTKDYPFYTPYQFAGNKPISAVDLDGLEEIDYRVMRVLENGTALVHIQITENTTSRSNAGALLIHNMGTGNSILSTPSRLLNQVLGIDPNNQSAFNPNIKEGVGGIFTIQQGHTEYYLQFRQSDLTSTGV